MAFTFGSAKNAQDTDMDFEPLPAGNYEFEIENVTLQEFKGSEKIKPCIQLHIQLRTDLKNGSSRKVWDDIKLDPTHNLSMNRLNKLVQSTGIPLRDEADEREISAVLIGQLCNAEVEIHEWNGKKSNRIKRYIVPKKEEKLETVVISDEDLPF